MANIMTKRGSQDNMVTYEHICDTRSDLANIDSAYVTLGSVALVLKGEDGLEVYMASSTKEWEPLILGGSAGGGGEAADGGFTIHVCTNAEIDNNGFPNIAVPDPATIYFVPNEGNVAGNIYKEYVYVNSAWEKFGDFVDNSQVTNAVNAWLAAHPEATTTVADGAVTAAKLGNDIKGDVLSIPDLKSAIDYLNEIKSNKKSIVYHRTLNNSITLNDVYLPNVSSKYGIFAKLSVEGTSNLLLRVNELNSGGTSLANTNLVYRGHGIWTLFWEKTNSNTAQARFVIQNTTGSQIFIDLWYCEGFAPMPDNIRVYGGDVDKSGALDAITKLSTDYIDLPGTVYNPNPTNTNKKLNEAEFTVQPTKLLLVPLSSFVANKSYNIVFKTDTDDDALCEIAYVSFNSVNYYPYNLGNGYYGIFDIKQSTGTANFRINNTTVNSIVLKEFYCTIDYCPFYLNNGITATNIHDGAVVRSKMSRDAIANTLANGTYEQIRSGQVQTNVEGGLTGKTFSDPFEIPVSKSVWYDFENMETEAKYTFILYAEGSPKASVIDGSTRTYFDYYGNNTYALVDYTPSNSTIRYRIDASSNYALVHKRTLIAKNAIPLDVPPVTKAYTGNAGINDVLRTKIDYDGISSTVAVSPYKYPLYPVWGNEYMYSWYTKIYQGTNAIKMVFAGDSTTEAKGRNTCGKKIMTLGGYPSNLITSVDKGHGTRTTAHWIGTNRGTSQEVPEYGYLHEDMALNPDLYVIAYGYNDGSLVNYPDTTVEERVSGFRDRLREGLGRIRTNGTYESGPSYNKSADDLAIIICTPNSVGNTNPQYASGYLDRIRDVIAEACRDFYCGFVDVMARQYDHSFSGSWSQTSQGPDYLHPTSICVMDFMSLFADLIYPICYHLES